MDRASKGTVWLFASQAVLLLTGFALNAFLGRTLGPTEFGIFGVVLLLNLTIVTALSAGISAESTRLIAAQPDKAKEINQETTKYLIFISIAVGSLIYLLSDFIAALLGNTQLANIIQFSVILIPLQTLFAQQTAFVNGLKEFKKQSTANMLFAVSKLLFTVILLSIGYRVLGAIIAYSLAPLIGYLFLFYKPTNKKYSFNTQTLMAFAVPYSLSAVALSLMNNVDVLFVQSIIQSESTTGHYLAASNIARLFPTMFGVAGVVLFPIIARSKDKLNDYLKLAAKYFSLIIIPAWLFVIAASYNLITSIYSETYVESVQYLPLLMTSAILSAITFTLFAVLNALGKTKTTLYLTLLSITSQIALLYYFTITQGALGAATGMIASNALILAITWWRVSKESGRFADYRTIIEILGIGLIITGLILYSNDLLPSKWFVLVQLPLAFGLFLITCVKLGIIKQEEKSFLKTALPGKLARFIDWLF
ncbi:oligosaccharide flippase family protein [Candidatus Micrarchaeota archaeon]|nr:oligosaccharide flippase family protein [Candidatus Micrarchaeota archaeon]